MALFSIHPGLQNKNSNEVNFISFYLLQLSQSSLLTGLGSIQGVQRLQVFPLCPQQRHQLYL